LNEQEKGEEAMAQKMLDVRQICRSNEALRNGYMLALFQTQCAKTWIQEV